MSLPRTLVLASTSRSRRELLARLQVPFTVADPAVDESALPGEEPAALVVRLAELKARAVASRFPGALVLGGDQVAVLEGRVLGKPGGFDPARAQLRAASGREVRFENGVCLYDAASDKAHVARVSTTVGFRELDAATIDEYLLREQPYDSAGSFYAESLGIALFQRVVGEDPTALQGFPLITVAALLRAAGWDVLRRTASA
ncbi:MAG: Maf family nucleotide pyrophosphatase [Magnetococcus sp. WYHC-3]